MPVGWFLAPYARRPNYGGRADRYVIVNDLTPQIFADGGFWSETEVLGQHAIVKVRATAATLQAVAGLPGVTRIPVARLDDPLSSLSNAQKNALRNRVQALGYTMSEIQARFPNDLGTYTLRQLLTFVASRRRKVRFDPVSDEVFDDGPEQPVRPVFDVDRDVADTNTAALLGVGR